MNINLDLLLEEINRESDEIIRMALSEYEDIETLLSEVTSMNINLDLLLEEINRESDEFISEH